MDDNPTRKGEEMKDWHELVSQPRHKMRVDKDVRIRMRDGTQICADIYRPASDGRYPALLSLSGYGKDIQKLPVPDYPTDSVLGNGGIESGDSEYFVSRGYVHVIADARGTGLSEGAYRILTRKEQEDGHDLVEWMASQKWCNGNVGMLGMSYFGMIQYLVAAQNPPHLKAICPVDASADQYRHFNRHGGIADIVFAFQWWAHILAHTVEPPDIPAAELRRTIEELKNDPDIRSFPTAYMHLMFPDKNPHLFDVLVHPYDGPFYWERSAYTKLAKIRVPCFIISRWTSFETHLAGAFCAYTGLDVPCKKLMLTIPESGVGFNRPWHEYHDIILRWYDHWLKGVDTGILQEPPIRMLVQGTRAWRDEHEWPLARTAWTPFYLRESAMLSTEPASSDEQPDSFSNVPGLKPGLAVPCVEYATEPLRADTEVTGPIALNYFAAIDHGDANWMAVLNDLDEQGAEKVVSKGWLRASHRAIDEQKSKPYQPYHPHTSSDPVEPGRICEYRMEIRETSYVFRKGHRIQLRIKGQDATWEGRTYAYRIHGHLPLSKQIRHTLHHSASHRSHLLLPIIPAGSR